MTSLTRSTILASAMGLIVAGCSSGSTGLPEMPSLREVLPTLQASSLSWRGDAYLQDVEVQIPGPPWLTSNVSAVFRSPSEEVQLALVRLDREGVVSTEILETLAPPSPETAITWDDRYLDPMQALDLALNDNERVWLEENVEEQCGFLQLRREPRLPAHPVVWRVALMPCPFGDAVLDITLDAATGEALEQEQ